MERLQNLDCDLKKVILLINLSRSYRKVRKSSLQNITNLSVTPYKFLAEKYSITFI